MTDTHGWLASAASLNSFYSPMPHMRNDDEFNPFRPTAFEEPPVEESNGSKSASKIIWLFVLPLVFAQLVYWPTFLFVDWTRLSASGFNAMLFSFCGTVAFGFFYGMTIGTRTLRPKDSGITIILYGFGEGLLCAFYAIAPCGMLFGNRYILY